MNRKLHVAVVGAGPAGIYACDILSKSGLEVEIDLFEKLPAPYGLVRYGVAPDHPRIKQIINALYKILERGDIRLLGNVDIGKDVTADELLEHYDAVIYATGSDKDAPLDIPGIDLPESYGAADFVYWYDGHPDYPRTWPLQAKEVAVIGVGNVALDISRVLAKHLKDILVTEIPANVAEGLAENPVTDVHIFGRRGPAQVKFTPLELRELGQVPDVDVIVYEEDFDFDEGSEQAIRSSNQTKQLVKTLTDWTLRDPESFTASRRIHIHLFHSPVEILGTDHVEGIRTERMKLNGDGSVSGTGEYIDTPVQAVYRAIGYFSSPIAGVPFDNEKGVIPNEEGRVFTLEGERVQRVFATGWVKRGPVGLIGSTKSDAQQTIANLVEDYNAGYLQASGEVGADVITTLLDGRGVKYTTWHGWELLDAYERELGDKYTSEHGVERERIKVVSREAMTAISRDEEEIPPLI
ncbi:FAD-dependent oxidoreductase [Actinomyces sp. zg-332]|uniref:FAD-dependent oxidoreductase n=1 Tax=Actinomyces sp. zg-332 TaxID=2708340 RepID=UPI0014246654|nr:FAD-dependent oxidoreductase [Actinomyces sp. zg-332]QPK94009.1 FAD-dependent oxidoreductase [Actinomyces sp. zg-332]